MKKHALITEIQLGRTIKEVADSLAEEHEFSGRTDVEEELEKIIQSLIQLNKPHVRFHITWGDWSCYLDILDKSWPQDLCWDYWDDEYGSANDDDAYYDCETLNQIIEKLFGIEQKKVKPTISQKEFVKKKGKICPFCGSKKIASLDHFHNRRTVSVLACSDCEKEWEEHYEMVLNKFKPI